MFIKLDYRGSVIKQYETLAKQLDALLTGEQDTIANLSNASALLNQFLDDVNWVGFYVIKNGMLVLGPFQGLPACVNIEIGRGVCGTAAAINETILVPDVHAFPGHIACDAASKSEIVVPLTINKEVIAVLDIDSPLLNRFSLDDQTGLELFVSTLIKHL